MTMLRPNKGAERLYVRRTDYAPAALRRTAKRADPGEAPSIVVACAVIIAVTLVACIALSFISCLIGA